MSGLIFLPSSDLQTTLDFYQARLGMELWLDQGDCAVLQLGNLLLGFCERKGDILDGIITFFYETRDEVDVRYMALQDIAEAPPKENKAFQIYHFFARDEENRKLEFQAFDHDLHPYLSAKDMLLTRRSIRKFKAREVVDEILWEIIESCRWAPTSRNSQGVMYTVIHQRETMEYLSGIRGSSSAPIAAAPMAVAVSADPEITSRPEQDACIASYHLTLAARSHGLGTCWIGGLNSEEVKARLGIPITHYLATVTPLGYPAERPEGRPRKPAEGLVRFLT